MRQTLAGGGGLAAGARRRRPPSPEPNQTPPASHAAHNGTSCLPTELRAAGQPASAAAAVEEEHVVYVDRFCNVRRHYGWGPPGGTDVAGAWQ
ncbi:hypothetical protein E2562_023838 [Oryza meyeriana var. granulata]|uniref:Uncharacterized protein n=1 Tax=Oryza meyeriana var. granulata TaxID=110450 RepID=A0A6G1D8X6_9ORYZ|nr:hypothetical protein E2562_023838 [Oryza meyeriana var. granulata]